MTETKEKETEKSKTAEDENFPVGSFLIPKALRRHVFDFYDFARTSDDIADSTTLTSEEKLQKLEEMEKVLLGQEEATEETLCAKKLKESLELCGVTAQHGLDLLTAFKQDAKGYTYNTWEDLIAYCRYSAGSVGRFMLDLHQESPTAYWPSDAICAALQINNHLQDCKEDYLEKQRVYLPNDWFKQADAEVKMLELSATQPELQNVFDQVVMGIESLLREGSSLPLVLKSRGLRMEICFIYRLAQRLAKRLKKEDILKQKVELKKIDWLFAGVIGTLGGLRRKKIKCIKKKELKKKKK